MSAPYDFWKGISHEETEQKRLYPVPAFKYVGNQNLRGKSKEEKLSIIKQYLDSGHYLTAEVKGATKGSQHWVAVTKVDGNSVIMVDPGSNQTIMWNAYNYEKTSQFNYFKVE